MGLVLLGSALGVVGSLASSHLWESYTAPQILVWFSVQGTIQGMWVTKDSVGAEQYVSDVVGNCVLFRASARAARSAVRMPTGSLRFRVKLSVENHGRRPATHVRIGFVFGDSIGPRPQLVATPNVNAVLANRETDFARNTDVIVIEAIPSRSKAVLALDYPVDRDQLKFVESKEGLQIAPEVRVISIDEGLRRAPLVYRLPVAYLDERFASIVGDLPPEWYALTPTWVDSAASYKLTVRAPSRAEGGCSDPASSAPPGRRPGELLDTVIPGPKAVDEVQRRQQSPGK